MSRKPPIVRVRKGRPAFFAVRDKVKDRLEAGFYLSQIYEELPAGFPVSYPQFVKLARRYLPGQVAPGGDTATVTHPPSPAAPEAQPGEPAAPTSPRTFKPEGPKVRAFNPDENRLDKYGQ